MNERKPVDTGDIELADLRGDLKAMLARTEGLSALFTAEVSALRTQLGGLDDRLCELATMIGDASKLARAALARLSDHREATVAELRELDRRCEERDKKLEERVRGLERRPASGMLTRQQKTALIAILAAIASALGFGGGAAGRALTEKDPPAKEAKP